MPTFHVDWVVTESGGPDRLKDHRLAGGQALKEASSAEAIKAELYPLLRVAFPEYAEFTTREYWVTVKEVQ